MGSVFWVSFCRALCHAEKIRGGLMDFKKYKRGELTTQQLVTIIILIASFVIVLFLFYRLNLGETTDKEICRNSVVLQEQASLTSGGLDCRTNYLCISGGDKCTEISQTSEINVDASKSVEETKDQVFKALADEMSDCWWQFGEGKINYGSKSPIEGTTQYAICSIVFFDDKIYEKFSEVNYRDFYDYLKTAKKTESQTYLQYLYGVNEWSDVPITYNVAFNLASDKILTNQKYSIITGIDNKIGTGEVIRPDVILKVYIIPTSETESRLFSKKEFLTKA